jgi:site-specific DNA recombinase
MEDRPSREKKIRSVRRKEWPVWVRGARLPAQKTFARAACKGMRTESGGYRRDHLRALAQRVEVDMKEVRIMGAKSLLLRTLVAASSAKTVGFGVPSSVPKWRARNDSNVRPPDS